MNYASLHNHCWASNQRFLDSINKPEDVIQKAISLGFSGIAFTDHESLSAAINILKIRDKIQAEHPDFKIIFGNEIYLIDESSVKNTRDYYHFILLAKDLTGWQQLKTLSSRAWGRGYTENGIMRVPTTYQDVEEVIGGDPGHIIASSACLGSELDKKILAHDVAGANNFVQWCIKVFGQDNFNLELQPSTNEEQIQVNRVLINFSKHYQIPYIITTDSHYLNKEDFDIHSAFLNSKQSSDRETEKFYRFTYMMTEDEMRSILKEGGLSDDEITTGLENTCQVSSKVEVFDFRHGTIVPKIRVPDFTLSKTLSGRGDYPLIDKYYDSSDPQDTYLMYQIEQGLKAKRVEIDEVKLDRINTELDVLDYISQNINQNLSAYLNLTVNIVDIAWQVSLVGAGRGCFLPGQMITMGDGSLKKIEDVKIGDKVITHLNNQREVYNLPQYNIQEEMYDIKSIGIDNIQCTNNHKFWAIKNGECLAPGCKNVYCTKFCKKFNVCAHSNANIKPEWIEAQHLSVGDWLLEPKIKPSGIQTIDLLYSDFVTDQTYSIINGYLQYKNCTNKYSGDNHLEVYNKVHITDELCRLFGYFIGNGWTVNNPDTKSYKTSISFNANHVEKIEDCKALFTKYFKEPSVIHAKNKCVTTLVVYGKPYALMFEQLFGKMATNKKVPQFILESTERIKQCLAGLFATDGSLDFIRGAAKYDTVSQLLINQISVMLNMINIPAGKMVHSVRNNWNTCYSIKINGLYFNRFIETIYPQKNNLISPRQFYSPCIKEDDQYFYRKITEISTFDYSGTVYDLSVLGDTSYCINNIAVHNSACGFYINYLIGITQADPLVYNLPYWRFLNKERAELPDVDEDFQPEKTEDIIKLLREEYGEDNVLNCATFKTESLKSSILTCGRGLGYNNNDMQALAALVPSHRGQTYTLKECLEGDEEKGFEPVPGFKDKLNCYPGLFEAVQKVEGLPTNASIHASALYVFNNGYLAQNSLMRAPNKTKMTAFNMHDSDDMGALKMDVLRTDAQSKMAKCLDLLLKDSQIEWQGSLRETYNKYLHPDVLDYDNPEMWEKAANGDIANLFQFETQVGAVCIKKARPTNVMQLAEINSIMRLQSDGDEQPIDRYVRFRNNPDAWDLEMMEEGLSLHEMDILKKYLSGSNGVSGSQEVLMRILMDEEVCHFTLGEANGARKAIAKKQAQKLIQLKKDFYEKGAATPNSGGQ